jgi:hypothetical protein
MTGSVFLKLNVDLIKKGIAAEMSGNAFRTLIALGCYMDSKGECFPSQRELVKKLGISAPTLKKSIEELLNIEINGNPILTRRFTGGGRGKKSVYTIHPISQLSKFKKDSKENKQEEIKVVKKTPKKTGFNSHSVLDYFMEKYKETYQDHYSPNFIRDCSLIKTKLVEVYKEEDIKRIIDILFKEYDKRWKKERYPRPTIVALCSFLINECLSIKSQQEEKWMKEQKALAEADKYKEQLEKMNDNNLPF